LLKLSVIDGLGDLDPPEWELLGAESPYMETAGTDDEGLQSDDECDWDAEPDSEHESKS
jgi:hypothetical protein